MISNYLKIAWRNLLKYKNYSLINIGGLAVGLTVIMLIGLWIYDEFSYNKSFKNYDRIAQVMQSQTVNGEVGTGVAVPIPTAKELRDSYGGDFKYIILSSWTEGHTISIGDKKIWKEGNYIGPDATEMLSLTMLKGTRAGLQEPNSMLISESMAEDLFGNSNPLNRTVKIDNMISVKVTGVYEDLPHNTQFHNMDYMVPWKVNVDIRDWVKFSETKWDNNSFQVFVQLAEKADMASVSARIKDLKLRKVDDFQKSFKPEIFLQPMSKWHLYAEFKNGMNVGGQIQFVWLFGIIGVFVLLLACINFMNLSTARSEKRAKEVGVRKAVGSLRGQLIGQFLSESLLVVFIAFAIALIGVQLLLPLFNQLADKQMTMLWTNPVFWTVGLAFCLLTGLIAGSYPAFYLSSFQAVSILKGTFRVGRFAALPRKVMVVVQFTVSVTLIIGTFMVFRQIQFAKNRPIGYNRNGLLYVQTTTSDIHNHFDVFRTELKASGVVTEVAESESPLTGVWHVNGGFSWEGKDPAQSPDFAVIGVSHQFGKTIDWELKAGRDFSEEYSTDSSSLIVNEAAVKFMGLKNPIGTVVREGSGKNALQYKIIGVIKDMVMESPYTPARQSFFYLSKYTGNFVNFKINPNVSASEALGTIESIFRKYNPASIFNYKFADEEYARKFAAEERIGTLALYFAILTIFISCLGLFGLASFVAEQRTKEIGVRKVLGASVFNLWRLLSKEFVILVLIAFAIATPVAWYFLNNWLQEYKYHTELSWWIFAVSGIGALLITLLTVSFQSIKAALINPVKSLRSE
ncbi:ABC transporter permease [Emticicia sp. C21]|nr:ABC transporter permease [Emticicia sp. C21]